MATSLLNKGTEKRNWMVLYTKSKCEKKAHHLLNLQGIQSYCPLIKTRRKWADRIKTVELPLFNSYLFVYVNCYEQLQVLQTSGIVNFVHYCGKPAVIPAADIERIKGFMDQYSDIEAVSVRGFKPGDHVTFSDGILFDRDGEVVEIHGKSVLVVLKQLDCALTTKVKVNFEHLLLINDVNQDFSV